MHIIECYVENFGKLHKYMYKADCGLNVICEGNGSGKTTLAVFIRAMFYGMPATRTRKLLDEAERKKYKPWQGGIWGGYLCFEAAGKEYRIERTFSDRDSQDTFRLLDMNTGLVSEDYSKNIGEELFGIDRDGFTSSIYIASHDLKILFNDSLSARIGDSPIESEDLNYYSKAMELLNVQYKKYGKNGKPHVEKELAEVRSLCEEKKAQYDALTMVTLPLSKEAYPQWKLSARQMSRLEELDDFFGAGMPDVEQIRECRQLLSECRKMLQATEQDIVQGVKQQSVKCQKKVQKISAAGTASKVFLVCAVICVICGWLSEYVLYLNIAGAVLAVLAGGLYVTDRIKKSQDNKHQIYDENILHKSQLEKKHITGQLDKVERLLKSFDLTKSLTFHNEEERIEQYREQLERLERAMMEYEHLSEKERDYRKAVELFRQKEQQHEQNTFIKEQMKLGSEIHDLEVKASQLKCQYEQARQKMELNEKTRHMLEQAHDKLVAGYLHGIRQYFKKYMNMFDSQFAERLSLDVEFKVGIEEDGIIRDMDYYSQGYKDVIRLCQRLALAESLFQKEKPFIILDDPFINLDDEMLGRAKHALDELSRSIQVIYFTCSWTREPEEQN